MIWILIGIKILSKKVLVHYWGVIFVFAFTNIVVALIGTIDYIAGRKIRNVIYLSTLLIILYIADQIKINLKSYKLLFQIPNILTLIFGLIALKPSSYDLGNYHNALYLNYQNPNILANVLLIILIFECLGRLKFKKWYYIVSIPITILLLYLTRSRSALLAGFLFLGLCALNPFYFKISTLLNFIVINIPLLVIAFSDTLNRILSMNILGKDTGLSGRNIIWVHSLNYIFSDIINFMFGIRDVELSINNITFSNCHNAYLQIMWLLGIPFFLVFIIILWVVTQRAISKIQNRFTFAAYMGMAILLLNNSFETNLTEGIMGMSFFTFLLIAIINSEKGQIKVCNRMKKN